MHTLLENVPCPRCQRCGVLRGFGLPHFGLVYCLYCSGNNPFSYVAVLRLVAR